MTQNEYEVGSLEDAEKFAIIRMAREAGFNDFAIGVRQENLERFAALVAAHERERCIAAIRKAHDEELCDAWDCVDVIKGLK